MGVSIRQLQFQVLSIPFRSTFRHASAERSETCSVWVRAASTDGIAGSGESCPRPYVTGETLDTARAFFSRHETSLREHVTDMASLRAWMDDRTEALDHDPAAWCAMELAVLDLLARSAGVAIEGLLGLPPLAGRFQYTAVLGDMGRNAFRALAAQYRQQGFSDFKVKLSGSLDEDRDKLAVLGEWPGIRVRADANNLWPTDEEAIAFVRALDARLFGIEEPIAPGQYGQLARIAATLGCKVILDESCARAAQIERLPGPPDSWIVNVRVSKMGGLLRSLQAVEAARAAGIGVIVGAQVGETSLLTRAGLTVAHACRDVLVAQEGAFGTLLLERDVCEPPLMFGRGGVLDAGAHPAAGRPGFGLTV